MRIKYTLTSVVAVLIFGLTSCENFLEHSPYDYPVEEDFWKTDDQAESGVLGTYSLLRYALGYESAYNVYGDLAGNDIYDVTISTDWTYITKMQLQNSSGTSSEIHNYRNWIRFYQVINQANRALEYLENSYSDDDFETEGRREVLIGELYFLRGFSYFYMYRIWGGVPMVTLVPSSVIGAEYLPRAQAEEIAELVYGDLYDAISRLDWDYATSESSASDKSYRANKAVAFATLAHMAAWDGDYVTCVAACDSIINCGEYSLESTVSDAVDNNSSETIFQQYYDSKDEATASLATGSSSINDFYHNFCCRPYWGNDASLGGASTDPGMQFVNNRITSLFSDSKDERYQNFFGYSPGAKLVCYKFNNFEEDTDGDVYCMNNRIIFRLADIILLRAEANAQLGNTSSAITDLNTIRRRAGLDDYDGSASITRAIIDERGRELFLEGHRYWDMCRYYFESGISLINNTSAQQMSNGKYLWPVDPDLFDNNIVTTQNTYWQGQL